MNAEGKIIDDVSENQARQILEVYQEAFPEFLRGGAVVEDELVGHVGDKNDLYVIEVDGEIVGAGQISYDEVSAELTGGAVKPQYQGRGLGRRLFSERAEVARSNSRKRVYTWASAHSPAAQATAEKEGFLPTGLEINSYAPGRQSSVHNVIMIDPDTLPDDNRTIYATDPMLNAVGSVLDTEIGNRTERDLQLIGREGKTGNSKKDTLLGQALNTAREFLDFSQPADGYHLEIIEGEGSTLTYGLPHFGDNQEKRVGNSRFVVGDASIENAWKEARSEKNRTAFVNINDPHSARCADYLIQEEGLRPTGINISKHPSFDRRNRNTYDMVILSDFESQTELDTSDKVSEWLDQVQMPIDVDEAPTGI